MLERATRTFICSVLFLDIVEYSRKPVAEQIQLKDRVNGLIASAIQEIPPADRIILDTGDGVAINFLADPEDALFVAMSLRDSFAPEPDEAPEVPARIGINLGPVRMVKDLNGQPNIIGDGINVSQRVMGFAKAGEILVSRSYYEVVSHISAGYTQLFSYQGSRTDKHVREHEIYKVGYSTASSALKSPAERARRAGTARSHNSSTVSDATAFIVQRARHWLNNRRLAYGTAAFSASAFLLALLTSFVTQPPQAEERPPVVSDELEHANNTGEDSSLTAAARTKQQQPPATLVGKVARDESAFAIDDDAAKDTNDAAPGVATAAVPEVDPVKNRRRLSFFKRRPAPEPAVVENEASQAESDRSASSFSEQSAASALSEPVAAASTKTAIGGRATVTLAIAPWGQVYVDGNNVGVSPPVNEVQVLPGSHTIEIRNGTFPPFIQKVELQARQKIKIRHKFN